MFDIAWSEMGLVAAVAVIILGPNELPKVVRFIAKTTKYVKNMANDFKKQLDEVAEIGELKKIKQEINEEIKTIVGNDGKLYESYDTSDLKHIHKNPNTNQEQS